MPAPRILATALLVLGGLAWSAISRPWPGAEWPTESPGGYIGNEITLTALYAMTDIPMTTAGNTYYFSCDAGGDYPMGSDADSGLTAALAFETWAGGAAIREVEGVTLRLDAADACFTFSGDAESWSWGCNFTNNLTSNKPDKWDINDGNLGCYRFVDTDSTSTSDLIVVNAPSALWCFDPDNAGTGITTATVTIHQCSSDGTAVAGGTGSVNTCRDIGGAGSNVTLTGTEGPPDSQNACVRTGPGAYYVRVTVACTKTSTNYCEVSVKGEK